MVVRKGELLKIPMPRSGGQLATLVRNLDPCVMADDGQYDAVEANGRSGDREVPRWVRSGKWCGGFFAILLLYFIIYPQILFRLDDVDFFEDWPEWSTDFLVISAEPIFWLAESFPFYSKLAGFHL